MAEGAAQGMSNSAAISAVHGFRGKHHGVIYGLHAEVKRERGKMGLRISTQNHRNSNQVGSEVPGLEGLGTARTGRKTPDFVRVTDEYSARNRCTQIGEEPEKGTRTTTSRSIKE